MAERLSCDRVSRSPSARCSFLCWVHPSLPACVAALARPGCVRDRDSLQLLCFLRVLVTPALAVHRRSVPATTEPGRASMLACTALAIVAEPDARLLVILPWPSRSRWRCRPSCRSPRPSPSRACAAGLDYDACGSGLADVRGRRPSSAAPRSTGRAGLPSLWCFIAGAGLDGAGRECAAASGASEDPEAEHRHTAAPSLRRARLCGW